MLGRIGHLRIGTFAVLCAAAFAMSVALTMLEATPSYADELEVASEAVADTSADKVEADGEELKHKVVIAGAGTQYVKTGEKAVKPTDLQDGTIDDLFPDAVHRWGGKRVVFYGWVKAEPFEQEKGLTLWTQFFANKLQRFDFDQPITEDVELKACYYVPAYTVVLHVVDPNGKTYDLSSEVVEGDTIFDKDSSVLQTDIASLYKDPTSAFPGLGYKAGDWCYVLSDKQFDPNAPIMKNTSIVNRLQKESSTPQEEEPAILPVAGSTGIVASGILQGPNIPEGATVSLGAATIASGETFNQLVAHVGGGEFAGVFEINLTVDGRAVHDGFGFMEVTFPVDKKYNGHWVTVYHRHNDGAITSERVVAKDGSVMIRVSDLSAFALEVGELAEEVKPLETGSDDGKGTKEGAECPSALAKTGDSALALVAGGCAAVAFVVGSIAMHRNRNRAK